MSYELLILPEFKQYFGEHIKIGKTGTMQKHILTHQRLFVKIIQLKSIPIVMKKDWFFVPISNLQELALPKIVDLLLRQILAF